MASLYRDGRFVEGVLWNAGQGRANGTGVRPTWALPCEHMFARRPLLLAAAVAQCCSWPLRALGRADRRGTLRRAFRRHALGSAGRAVRRRPA